MTPALVDSKVLLDIATRDPSLEVISPLWLNRNTNQSNL